MLDAHLLGILTIFADTTPASEQPARVVVTGGVKQLDDVEPRANVTIDYHSQAV